MSWRDTCVCKIDVKCNIASKYCLAFNIQYSASNERENEEILSIDQNYPPFTEHHKNGDEELVPKIIKLINFLEP